MMTFTQAPIAIENEHAYGELKSILTSALISANVEEFLQAVGSSGCRIREFESVLRAKVFDKFVASGAKTVQQLYSELSLSDQGQFREYYLTRIEEIDGNFRAKYKNLFRYS